ncbi:hypothetical protein PENARI_c005G07688 [Penicillium arizonense]|uniref:Uncharacterized protein n=1 Tax=Penicillium arizonense TaxID=1835702 RepID=A0A1F5LP75_PENAI|nr:hypothetical protein PENARI_c005G07688 [Penicillium arizonense]OGE54896.1 hypothetical protein PENARI_c005G07688 [Penicillium arizonense]
MPLIPKFTFYKRSRLQPLYSTYSFHIQKPQKMYTYTPTHRFLVLSATESGPYDPSNKFLVLSPTESGPDPRVWEDQPQVETSSTEQSPNVTLNRARTNSSLSTSSSSSLNDLVATLPNGFLYLGHGKKH